MIESSGWMRLLPVLLISQIAFAAAAMAQGEASAPTTRGAWTEMKVPWGYRGALATDPSTGNVFGACWKGKGVLMSSDLGKTFARVGGDAVDGSPFSAYAILIAPEGGKIAVFSSQKNAPSGHSLDGGKTWVTWTKVGSHGLEYGVVDWAGGAVFAMPHEEPKAYFSADMGKSWVKLDAVDYPGGSNRPHDVNKFKYCQSGMGIFSPTELVLSHDSRSGIQRSEDGGKTWSKVADYFCQGPVQVFNGVGYWLAKQEKDGKWQCLLLASKDKGKTWAPVGKPIDNGPSSYMAVPHFGKSEKHIVVAAADGIMETTNGGDDWKLAVKYPDAVAGQLNARFVDTEDTFGYDPLHDAFYMLFWYDPWDGGKHPQQQAWAFVR